MILITEKLISLLSPTSCYLCQTDREIICEACALQQLKPEDIRCYMCNKITKNPGKCKSCSSRLRRVWWLGSYRKELKEVIVAMKYERRRDYARCLGVRLASRLPFIPEDTIVVPIPTAASRVRARGFDQSVLMAKALANKLELPYQDCLGRITTVDLIGKTRAQRIKAMESSLVINRPLPKKSNVLLIDDVITTGATLESAARLIREAGASHVDAASAAH